MEAFGSEPKAYEIDQEYQAYADMAEYLIQVVSNSTKGMEVRTLNRIEFRAPGGHIFGYSTSLAPVELLLEAPSPLYKDRVKYFNKFPPLTAQPHHLEPQIVGESLK